MSTDSTRIGVDVGGTNTDIILTEGARSHTYKLPTTEDPSMSTATGVREVCRRNEIDPVEVDTVLHGTTVGTNALLEHEGAPTGMLTTRGFRDVIHIGRHRKLHTFSLQHILPWQKYPIVKRRHRKPIEERIYPPGEVVKPLDEDRVLEAAEELVEDGIEAIAVCYLHSYLNPSHEERTKELIEDEYPELFVCTSSEVVAQFREFERFTTTAINARLGPVMSSYLNRLRDRLRDKGFDDIDVLIMQSNGGMASVRAASRKPVTTLLSGPAAGVLSGNFVGDAADESRLITFDMGGTSADISVVPGRLLERDPRDSKVAEYPTITPMLDIETIGSGGGSIAWFDQAKGFNVGPKSAGADPGPACYNRGGEAPTITDAQLVLGRLDVDSFLGGELAVDPDLAVNAIDEHLCGHVDHARFETPTSAALAVLEVATTNMYQSIRKQTMQRGFDPRLYTLVAFGGAGPMHAIDLAEALDVSKVLIPPFPGISSARGLLTGTIKYDNQVTISRALTEVDTETVEEQRQELLSVGRDQLRKDGVDIDQHASFRTTVDCLYEGQGYELNVELEGTTGDWQVRVRDRFERKHEAEYGHSFDEDPVVLLNLRVTAEAESEAYDPPVLERGGEDPSGALKREEPVVFGGQRQARTETTPRYERERLAAGNVLEGPAIVDEFDSTIVITPEWRGRVRDSGTIVLEGGD